ncbi:MAG: sigma-54-dependent transcriptional regulator [Candidatus Competibacterales bacterium]
MVLLVEDSPALAKVYSAYLKGTPHRVVAAATGAEALAHLEGELPHVVLLDLKLPDMDGMTILKQIQSRALPCAVVVITAHGSVDVAVEAMRCGAVDFLEKPFDAKRLRVTVANALERRRLVELVDHYRELDRDHYCGFIGASLAMQRVYHTIDAAAPSKATVFITGESGTGKEVCAEAIHRRGPRQEGPFVPLNCAAIPRDLMESEIFGHVKGAFTGAVGSRTGAAARADGGTLFLDEICEMDLDLQAKLLRFIQTGTFQPVGGTALTSVDVRFVCATNRDPLAEVAAGRFREDLYYRLHVIPIALPPLREREDDVMLIAHHFLAQYAREEGKAFGGFDGEAADRLRRYPWPGNVRQLQNVVRNIAVLHRGERVTEAMLPPPLDGLTGPSPAPLASPEGAPPALTGAKTSPLRPLWQVERDAIEAAIAHCNGNIPRAAALLEISPSTIYRKRQVWQGR